jgi:hypothetical protein
MYPPWVTANYFDAERRVAIESMVRLENFIQFSQAIAAHNPLHKTAIETDAYPNGRDTKRMAGMKKKATIRNATVTVYSVPVDFGSEANMATSWLSGWLRRREQKRLT